MTALRPVSVWVNDERPELSARAAGPRGANARTPISTVSLPASWWAGLACVLAAGLPLAQLVDELLAVSELFTVSYHQLVYCRQLASQRRPAACCWSVRASCLLKDRAARTALLHPLDGPNSCLPVPLRSLSCWSAAFLNYHVRPSPPRFSLLRQDLCQQKRAAPWHGGWKDVILRLCSGRVARLYTLVNWPPQFPWIRPWIPVSWCPWIAVSLLRPGLLASSTEWIAYKRRIMNE